MRWIAVLAFAGGVACSFSEDFDRFTAGDARDGSPGAHDASSADVARNDAGPGPASLDCKGSDPTLLLCADFEFGALEEGWIRLWSLAPTDTARLDTSVFHSGVRAGRFSVSAPSSQPDYVFLLGEVPRADRIQVSGWAYLDVTSLADLGTAAIVSIAYADQLDVVKLRFAAADSDVSHQGMAYKKFPLSAQPPVGRFFNFALLRDEVNRTVSANVNFDQVLPPTPLPGTRPAATVMQIRVGLVNAFDAKAPVSIVLDDVQVRTF